MIRPGLALLLWLAIAVLVVANNVVGDTIMAGAIGPRDAAWYKVLLPMPYVTMMALIHARRTTGPAWQGAALLAGVLWAVSTAAVDAAFGRLTYGESTDALLDRYGVFDGAPWPWLLLVALATPWLCAAALAKRKRPAQPAGRS
jgi:hypothetical protein